MLHKTLISFLSSEVKPALGCTEPAAVAWTTAQAKNLLGGRIELVEVTVSRNIYKNAMSVIVPPTQEAGVSIAAALGVVMEGPAEDLLLLQSVTVTDVAKARELTEQGKVKLVLSEQEGVYIRARVIGNRGWAEAHVAGSHTNMVKAIVNGATILTLREDGFESKSAMVDFTGYSFGELVKTVVNLPLEDISFLQAGIEMNLFIAEKGLENTVGLGVGTGLKSLLAKGLLSNDLANRVRMNVAAACDARMAGLRLPVMTTVGSGNHGIVAIVPVAIAAREMNASQTQVLRALALSHVITAYVKNHTGRLSPVCGCAVAAGAGAAAALTWLWGGNLAQMEGAVKNIIGNLVGMLCDGAKGGCALKLSTSAGEAVIAAQLALQNVIVSSSDGIVAETLEGTVQNLGQISTDGMLSTDPVILAVLMRKQQEKELEKDTQVSDN